MRAPCIIQKVFFLSTAKLNKFLFCMIMDEHTLGYRTVQLQHVYWQLMRNNSV